MRRIKYQRYEFHDPDPEERKAPLSRYTIVKFKRDSTFDHITDWREWIHAVAEKHRDTYRRVIQGSENEDVT